MTRSLGSLCCPSAWAKFATMWRRQFDSARPVIGQTEAGVVAAIETVTASARNTAAARIRARRAGAGRLAIAADTRSSSVDPADGTNPLAAVAGRDGFHEASSTNIAAYTAGATPVEGTIASQAGSVAAR